jgi:hypothetical protein
MNSTPNNDVLARTIDSFNRREYDEAANLTNTMLQDVVGKDELFWLGMSEACRGFSLIMGGELRKSQPLMVAAMEKLRNFGYRHQNLEITSVLAGLRRGIEESTMVLNKDKRVFDLSLLPKLKMSARADNR